MINCTACCNAIRSVAVSHHEVGVGGILVSNLAVCGREAVDRGGMARVDACCGINGCKGFGGARSVVAISHHEFGVGVIKVSHLAVCGRNAIDREFFCGVDY